MMKVVAADVVVRVVADAVVGEASLPDGEFGDETVGVATLDELHRSLESDVGWCDEEMQMIGHDDVGV